MMPPWPVKDDPEGDLSNWLEGEDFTNLEEDWATGDNLLFFFSVVSHTPS